jgi:hypothetical protein
MDDWKKVVDGSYVNVQVNGVDVIKGKTIFFPIGIGMQGNTSVTDTEVFSLGVPSTASVKPLDVPQWIESAQDLSGYIEFQSRLWDTVAAPAVFQMPNLTTAMHVMIMLKGIMWS